MSCPKARPKTVSYKAVTRLHWFADLVCKEVQRLIAAPANGAQCEGPLLRRRFRKKCPSLVPAARALKSVKSTARSLVADAEWRAIPVRKVHGGFRAGREGSSPRGGGSLEAYAHAQPLVRTVGPARESIPPRIRTRGCRDEEQQSWGLFLKICNAPSRRDVAPFVSQVARW